MKITAVGDCAVQKRLPKFYEGFEEIKAFLSAGDVRFFNLETTVCTDCFAARHSGGTWLRTSPLSLADFTEFGFNATTIANNHCMDYSYGGLLQTLENVKANGLAQSGAGRTLAEASAPVYIDTPAGRAAMISVSTTFSPGAEAGEQTRDLPGRPGINTIHVVKKAFVDREDFDRLCEIAEKTALNGSDKLLIAEGYLQPDREECVHIGGIAFRIGTPRVEFDVDEEDLRRLERSIRDAAFQADTVLISIHSHEIEGTKKEETPAFLARIAHFCIDHGAHAVIGHGPHLLRPVEIYRERPIFYSLGDFVLQLENGEIVPDEYYKKFGLTPDAGIYEVFKKRTRDFTVGLQRQPEMMEAVAVSFELREGKLASMRFLPVELGLGMNHAGIGWPRVARDRGILERLAAMSPGVSIGAEGEASW